MILFSIFTCLLTITRFLFLPRFISTYQVNMTNQSRECVTWIKKHVFDNTEYHVDKKRETNLIYINYDDFNQLNGLATNCQNLTFQTDNLLLNAETRILLEENLYLTKLLNFVNFTNSNLNSIIILRNIFGFNQYQNVKKLPAIELANYDTVFYSGAFDFYLNKSLITMDTCRHDLFLSKQINYFWPMRNVFFMDISYSGLVCPFVFLNSYLDQLGLYQITNSLIFKNRLEFININETDLTQIGLNIKGLESLELNIVFESLSSKILSPLLFRDTRIIQISGSLYSIQTDLFQSFRRLEILYLKLDNFRDFFGDNLKWTLYLNRDFSIKNRIILLVFIETTLQEIPSKYYTYPDEDLCLFKEFPHEQHVIPLFPVLFNNLECSCSCTLIWLIKNYDLILTNFNLYQNFGQQNLSQSNCVKNFSILFDACQFKRKFNQCLSSSSPYRINLGPSIFQLTFFFEWLKLVIQVYFRTFLSIGGFLLNILVICVLKNKTKNKSSKNPFDNVMYKHIFYNSLFNCLFCLLNIFSLMNICVFPKSSFCSSIYKTEFAQYSKIILFLFVGNSVRLCSNFSFILFSISRFYISTSRKSSLFHLFEKLNLKRFYSIMFILCSLWSMFKLFEYRPNEVFSTYDKNFPYNRYDLKYCQYSHEDYKFLSLGCKIFPILNVLNNILNNILFIFVSLLIDICLLKFTHKNYKHKKELFKDKKHIEEALEHKKKVKKVILTNGLVFFLSHMPEFMATLVIIVYGNELKMFCFSFFSCTDLLEIFETFSFIGICLQFFVYKHFDKNFIESFENLKERFST